MALVLLPQTFATRQMLDDRFRSCGAEPNVIAEMNTIGPMMVLVSKTNTLASIVAANAMRITPDVIAVRIESPTLYRTSGMLWAPQARESAATRALSATGWFPITGVLEVQGTSRFDQPRLTCLSFMS